MAVSKRTRYEVLKRDNFTCRYCRSTEDSLKVDHVIPVALGGSDSPDNLVAACHDCNAGKSSTSPNEGTVTQVTEDAMRWAAAIRSAADVMLTETQASAARHEWFLEEWRDWDKDGSSLPDGWAKSLDYWLGAGLPQAVLLSCLNIALGNRNVAHHDVFIYMGGIARKKIAELHESAKALLEAEAVDDA